MGFDFGFMLCFPGNAIVQTPHGPKCMRDVNLGDVLRVVACDGRLQWSPVIAFGHRDATMVAPYVRLSTATRQITLSHEHLIGVMSGGNRIEYIFAGEAVVGTPLVGCQENGVYSDVVRNVSVVHEQGVYAPFTMEGTLVVDGVGASCYASTRSHTAAHAAMKPLRHTWAHHPERAAGRHTGQRLAGSHHFVETMAHLAGKV